MQGRNLDDNAADEIEKVLAEELQPLGLSVTKKCGGGTYEKLEINKLRDWNEVEIRCVQ